MHAPIGHRWSLVYGNEMLWKRTLTHDDAGYFSGGRRIVCFRILILCTAEPQDVDGLISVLLFTIIPMGSYLFVHVHEMTRVGVPWTKSSQLSSITIDMLNSLHQEGM